MMLFQFIAIQVIVFGFVIFFLKKIFHGDTNSAIQRLGHVHQQMLQSQAELKEQIAASEKELQDKKDEAATIVEKLKEDALLEMRKREDEVIKMARAQADELIAKAQGAKEEMAKEIESQLSKKMILFASEVVQKALSEKVGAAVHHALVSDFISKAKAADLSAAGITTDEVIVRAPAALTAEELEKINVLFVEKMGRAIRLNQVVDSGIMCGIIAQIGTLVLDGSLAAILRDAASHIKAKY